MKHIYILDEHQSSKKNGIGIFIEELIYCLQQLNTEICLISFNSDVDEFDITREENGIKHMYFPLSPDNFTNQYVVIEKFFRLYIKDSSQNIFFLNHFPCDAFLETMKGSFPLSKFLLVIHNQIWTTSLLGDRNKLQEIVSGEKYEETRDRYSYFRFSTV